MENLFNQEMATKLYGKEMKEEAQEEERLIAIKNMAEGYLECEISRDRCLFIIEKKYSNVEPSVIESIVDKVYL